MSPTPQLQRPQYGRGASSPVPNSYASQSSSSRIQTPLTAAGRQRQVSTNSSQGQSHYGYGAQEGRSSPGSAHMASRQSHHGYYDDRGHHTYSSRPGSAAGSTSSLGRDSYRYSAYEEPTSPTASSVSSIASSIRLMDRMKIQVEDAEPYAPIRGDELDEEFAKVVNASPIQIPVRRLGDGKYYFGGRMDDSGSSLIGGKMVLCRLMEYGRLAAEEDSGVSSGGSHSGTDDGIHPQPNHSRTQLGARRSMHSGGSLAALHAEEASQHGKKRPRKVLCRVGGGWQDLDIFLLDHSNLATESIGVRGY
ncbi:hypothetical protein BGZ54_008549 [Gamsiella multidivaricata]|nr:hypothetical protein BGZ54_008549 [Gamsiella multidivaricata]